MVGFIGMAVVAFFMYREISGKDTEISTLKYELNNADYRNNLLRCASISALDEKEAMIRLCKLKGIDHKEVYSNIIREVREERQAKEEQAERDKLLNE
ncbi:hypothetical protein ACI1HS_003978 [Vibrio parahaemolyticus]